MGLEVVQYRPLALQRPDSLETGRNHADVEMVAASMQIDYLDHRIWDHLEDLVDHPALRDHEARRVLDVLKLRFECGPNRIKVLGNRAAFVNESRAHHCDVDAPLGYHRGVVVFDAAVNHQLGSTAA